MLGNFTHHNPVRVHFGPDSLDQLPGELAGYGPRSSWPTAADRSSEAAYTAR
ncbi:hypothetical protein SAMN04487824_1238 [Parafannyhessea umbonata]|uniref:Uncharacterized protein n=1 Tax=Parafannyhessea umbonata TaxID=604330 RepID=A0A1G6MN50_9ACTN|nr:hypothetical protein SAMN04487824_1238 [Parafannyhessea umbonata]